MMFVRSGPTVLEGLRAMRAAGLATINEAQILCEVQRNQKLTVSELAVSIDLPMSTTSRVVHELTKIGLLEYGYTDADRRKRIVRLGAQGKKR